MSCDSLASAANEQILCFTHKSKKFYNRYGTCKAIHPIIIYIYFFPNRAYCIAFWTYLVCVINYSFVRTGKSNIMQTYPICCDGCFCAQCIRTQEVGIVEDLGQFKRILSPGLHCIVWPLQSIVGRLSLRVQQLDVICETKTKDNVFVKVQVAVQYRVLQDSAYDAFYRLTDPHSQIKAYVFDVVRYVKF